MAESQSTKIIVALDYADPGEAESLLAAIDPRCCKLKVGKELFTRAGPDFVASLVARDFEVFLDLKFHDIPNTTAQAVAAAADIGVWMVNVHALGGRRMMEAAAGVLERNNSATLLTAVTVLTSMADQDLREIGMPGSVEEQVERLALLARESGVDGVVCSAHEASSIAESCGADFVRVTPGIRPAGYGARDDQRRSMTPAEALAAGSSYLVVGRPITRSVDPAAALLDIRRQIGED